MPGDVHQAKRVADVHVGDVDLDPLGNLHRQRLDVDLARDLREHAALLRADGLADELDHDLRLDRLVEADLLEVDVGDAAGDHVLLVVLEDRRMGRLLAFEHDVEDRVQARGAGQDAAKLSLGDTDRVRRLPAPVEDAGNHPVAAQAARIGGTASLALRYFQLDSFTCHGAAV